MEDRLIVTASPHIREASTTRGLMGNVVIALLPAVLAAGLIFGVQALVLVAVTTLACVAFEYIYEKLLNDKLSANLGYLYENTVAQILTANGNALFYHTFMNESTRRNYEIDFILARKNKVCPIEVKSSGYKTHASLDAFSRKFSDRILDKYLIYTKDFAKDEDIFCLPTYLVQFL